MCIRDRSTTYTLDTNATTNTETCNASEFSENGGSDRHHVPHFLPGQNTALTEWLKNEPWVPADAARGGDKTLYPEYRSGAATVPASRSAVPITVLM